MRLDRWVWFWTCVGLVVRAVVYVDRPLWLDEALQVSLALSPSLEAITSQDLHPPALTWLLSVFVDERSVALARAPSFIASVLSVPLAGWAGEAWGERRTGIAMAAVAALCPPWVLYAGEARPYALGLMMVCGLLASAASQAPRWTALWAFGASMTQYGAWPLVHVALAARAWKERSIEAGVVWFLVAWVQVVLLAGVLLPQLEGPGAGLTEGALAHAFLQETSPAYHLMMSTVELGTYLATGTRSMALLFVGGLMWFGLGAAVALGKRDGALAMALVPLVVFFGASLVGLHPFGGTRHLLVLAPAWFLVMFRLHEAVGGVVALVALASAVALPARLPIEDVPAVLAQVDGELVVDASAWHAVSLRREAPSLPWVGGATWSDALVTQAGRHPIWLLWAESRAGLVEEQIEVLLDQRWSRGREVVADGAYAVCLAPPGTECPHGR